MACIYSTEWPVSTARNGLYLQHGIHAGALHFSRLISLFKTCVIKHKHSREKQENGFIYRVIRKSLRDVRPLRYSSRDGHAEGEHVNRGRDTPIFCPTLQVLIWSFLLCLSWLLCSRFRKFRRDLQITLYIGNKEAFCSFNTCRLICVYLP
jgi:hypothetical protein